MQEGKRRLVQQWVANATEDLQLAQEIIANNRPYYRAAVYHCQQSAEMILKGFLVLKDQDPSMSHNVRTLAERVKALHPELSSKLSEADYLTQFNQTYRYPGSPTEDRVPTSGELKKAFRIAREVYRNVVAAMPEEVVGQKREQSQQPQQQQAKDLWNAYSKNLAPQSSEQRTRAVIQAATQDGLSKEAIIKILDHDPFVQSVRQRLKPDKAQEFVEMLIEPSSEHQTPNQYNQDQGLSL